LRKNYTKKIPTLRLKDTLTPSKRSSSIQYYLQTADDRVRICKVLFLNTIGINEKDCLKILSHKDSNNSTSNHDIDDNFKTTEDALNISNNQRITKITVSEKKSFLNKFLNTLPKLESHYYRASTSKLYLEPNWTSKIELYNFIVMIIAPLIKPHQ
jgi:hypothetical protein